MNKLRPILLTFLALASLLTVACSPNFEQGKAAYERGDYETARKHWEPLAEGGDVQAQTYLGTMYADGKGVDADEARGLEWSRRAATQGFAKAQFNIGVIYAMGQGVEQDCAEATMWFLLARTGGIEKADDGIRLCKAQLSAEQFEQAQKLAADWKPEG